MTIDIIALLELLNATTCAVRSETPARPAQADPQASLHPGDPLPHEKQRTDTAALSQAAAAAEIFRVAITAQPETVTASEALETGGNFDIENAWAFLAGIKGYEQQSSGLTMMEHIHTAFENTEGVYDDPHDYVLGYVYAMTNKVNLHP